MDTKSSLYDLHLVLQIMFYKSLAKKLRPLITDQRRLAQEAREELSETAGFSDVYLAGLIIGGSLYMRSIAHTIKTRQAIIGYLFLYIVLFIGYLGLKKWESLRRGPKLQQYVDKVD